MLVNRLATQYELVILRKRLIEVETETEVVHRFVYTVRDTILVLYLLTCQTVLCAVNRIHLCALCEDTQSDVVVTHRTRAFVALETEVSELNVTVDNRLVGWFL